ncbi:MAG: ABC transporter substrate-binding protein [Pseudolabrys sp.]
MRRREFVTLLGGAAVAWPLAARAQQPDRIRRIGALLNYAADDPEGQSRVATFQKTLQELGWTEGQSFKIDYRWRGASAAELVKSAPDVIVVAGTSNLAAAQQASRTIPIVFVGVTDPVGSGFVASLARPGCNSTGFSLFEYSMGGKWLELLKQVAPGVMRAGVLRNPALASGIGQFSAIQSAALSSAVELSPIDVRDAGEIERAIATLSRSPNSGLIVTAGTFSIKYRDLIVALAARHQLPTVYCYRLFVNGGGLISYGPDVNDLYRHAANYVDRILKGEKPADLPVQAPTKYEVVINLKTAKALGLTISPTVLARADEVIE